jgi:hypothetical protein
MKVNSNALLQRKIRGRRSNVDLSFDIVATLIGRQRERRRRKILFFPPPATRHPPLLTLFMQNNLE